MRIGIFSIPVLLAVVFGGCNYQPYVNPDRLQRGLVIVLPGIEGRGMLNKQICQGLDEGGVNWAIELTDWTSTWGPLVSLRSEERNRREARKIAERIERYMVAYPGRPVALVGQSGGAAIAVWASESLPAGERVDGLVLLNASLSREYRLTQALRHTLNGIASFYSARDWVLLGLGTTVYGTMDGEHAVSAGKEGFLVPTDLPQSYRKLFQIPWNPNMAETGHHGLHMTSSATAFVARYVAPLILAEEWDESFMQELMEHDPRERHGSPVKPGQEPPDSPDSTETPSGDSPSDDDMPDAPDSPDNGSPTDQPEKKSPPSGGFVSRQTLGKIHWR